MTAPADARIQDQATIPSGPGQAAQFIGTLTGTGDGWTTPVTFQTFDDSPAKRSDLIGIRHGTLVQHAKWLTAQNAKGAGVFVTINATDLKGRSAKNVVGLRALFVDDDHRAIADPLALQPSPSMVVMSRNGSHAYWLLDPGEDIAHFEQAQAAIAHHLGTDAKVKDLPRVMRLPGFLHQKNPAEPFPVSLLAADASMKYTIATLMAVYPPLAVEAPARAPYTPPAPVSGKSATKSEREAHYARQALRRAADEIGDQAPGGRNDFLNKQAFKMGGYVGAGALDYATAEAELLAAGVGCGLSESEARTTIKSALTAGTKEPRDLSSIGVPRVLRAAPVSRPTPAAPASGDGDPDDYTELGMSYRFARQYGDRVKFCGALGFVVFDGKRWVQDDGKAQEIAKRMIQGIGREAKKAHEEAGRIEGRYSELIANEDDGAEDMRKAAKAAKARAAGLTKACKDLSKRATVKAILGLASSDPLVAIDASEFDRGKFLFNCDNGTIDLTTGRLQPHDPRDLITKVSPVKYDPKATCPTWERFLSEIMAGRAPLVTFLQLSIGYSLSGSTREQCFFIEYGKGANGKTVFSKTFRALSGEYGSETPAETLMVKRNENAVPNDLARLVGVRYVGANETEDGQRLAEAKVKGLTGDDPIVARFFRKEFFEFEPEFKLWLRTNHKPVIKGTDEGIWRRIRLIPFDVQFTAEKQDKTLQDRLLAELPGILAWAVRGCIEWQRRGNLAEPDEVRAAVAEYRQDSDTLGSFLETLDAEKYRSKELHDLYLKWCEEAGERQRLNMKVFGSRLSEAGWGFHTGHANARYRVHPDALAAKSGLTVNPGSPFSQENKNVENQIPMGVYTENGSPRLTVNQKTPPFPPPPLPFTGRRSGPHVAAAAAMEEDA
jgi:P4 family phage/plasmid primase-like protien